MGGAIWVIWGFVRWSRGEEEMRLCSTPEAGLLFMAVIRLESTVR